MKKTLTILAVGSVVLGVYVARKLAGLQNDIDKLMVDYKDIQLTNNE